MSSLEDSAQVKMLKRLVYAAQFNGIKAFLPITDKGGDIIMGEARIAWYGVEKSIQLLYKGLTERDIGFNWRRDTKDPAALHEEHYAHTIVNEALYMIDFHKKTSEVNVVVDWDPVAIEGEQRNPPIVEAVQNNVEMMEVDDDGAQQDYGLNKFEKRVVEGNPQVEHYKYIDGKLELKLKAIKVLMICEKKVKGHFLRDKFVDSLNGRFDMNIVFAYNPSVIKQILSQRGFYKNYEIYQAKLKFDHDPTNPQEWWEHISKMLMIYICLSVARFKWKQLKIRTLFNYTEGSLLSNIVKYLWPKQKEHIKQELDYIAANPDALFCKECDNLCRHQDKYWHMNLSQFVETGFKTSMPESTIFIKNNNVYESTDRDLVNKPLYRKLRDLYQENNTFSIQSLQKTLQIFASEWDTDKPKEFCTYLLVYVDDNERLTRKDREVLEQEGLKCEDEVKLEQEDLMGDDEEELERGEILCEGHEDSEQKTPVKKLLETQDVFVYVGRTNEPDYRKMHFMNISGKTQPDTNKILTTRTRVFHARKCVSTDVLAIAYDESFMIAFLIALRNKYLNQGKVNKFYLINKLSGATNMFGCSKERLMEIDTYIKQGKLLFDPENQQVSLRNPGECTGDLGLKEITNEVKVKFQKQSKAMKTRSVIMNRNILDERKSANVLLSHDVEPRCYEISSDSE